LITPLSPSYSYERGEFWKSLHITYYDSIIVSGYGQYLSSNLLPVEAKVRSLSPGKSGRQILPSLESLPAPTYSTELIVAVQRLREEYPRTGKISWQCYCTGRGILVLLPQPFPG